MRPMPAALVGVGVVEDWVAPGEALPDLTVDPARRAALGDSERQHLARLLAEERLAEARQHWLVEQRSTPAQVPEAAVSSRRPRPGPITTAGLEILETRRWALVPARCEFGDWEAFR